MNNFRTIITIAGILIAGIAFNSIAQEAPKKSGKSSQGRYTYKLEKNKNKNQDKNCKMIMKPYEEKHHKNKYKLKADRRTREDWSNG